MKIEQLMPASPRSCPPLSLSITRASLFLCWVMWGRPAWSEEPPPPQRVVADERTDAKANDTVASTAEEAVAEAADDAAEEDDGTVGDESEAEQPAAPGADAAIHYTADLSDNDLVQRFVSDLAGLGSVSVGLAEEGRLINGVQLTSNDALQVLVPEYAWAASEVTAAIEDVARTLHDKFPDRPALRVSHVGKQNGGFIRGHFSHQSGRDVDFGFFYKPGVDPGHIQGRREDLIDLAMNWALIRLLATETDTQVILVDRRIQRALYAFALSQGEDKAWLDTLFGAGNSALVRHARRHRDHFHVRIYAPRAQELGRRVQPILAKRPDENLAIYRIRGGDTLGHIAMRYNSTVSLIQKANRMRGTLLSIGRTLVVPLRGPCTRCPLPPVTLLPPRRLPPAVADSAPTPTPVSAPTTEPAATPTATPAADGVSLSPSEPSQPTG